MYGLVFLTEIKQISVSLRALIHWYSYIRIDRGSSKLSLKLRHGWLIMSEKMMTVIAYPFLNLSKSIFIKKFRLPVFTARAYQEVLTVYTRHAILSEVFHGENVSIIIHDIYDTYFSDESHLFPWRNEQKWIHLIHQGWAQILSEKMVSILFLRERVHN